MTHLGNTHNIFIYHWLSEQSASSHAISPNGFTDNYDMAVKESLSQKEPLFLTQDFNSFRREHLMKNRRKAPGCASEFPGCTEIPSSQITAEACSIVNFLFCIFDILSRQRLVQYHLS